MRGAYQIESWPHEEKCGSLLQWDEGRLDFEQGFVLGLGGKARLQHLPAALRGLRFPVRLQIFRRRFAQSRLALRRKRRQQRNPALFTT